jgi:hypothetical protein
MNAETLEYKIKLLPDNLKDDVNLFIDFVLYKSNQHKKKVKREPGFMKGKIIMSDDFDEPLEDFKEYM